VRAVATTFAAAAAFGTLYAAARGLGGGLQAPVVAVVLVLALARRPLPESGSGIATYLISIPALGIAAGGVGWLLLAHPWAGAAVFTAGMVLSVRLRDFGPAARRIGGLIAMPLVGMLVVPVLPGSVGGGPLVELGLVALAGLAALGYVALASVIARRLGYALLPAGEGRPERGAPAERARPGAGARVGAVPQPGSGALAVAPGEKRKLSAATRMAAQMGVALAAAFVVGFALFPGHWSWSVITAFIVCSGARGRGDAAYKGVLRLGGAVAGTVIAAVSVPLVVLAGPPLAGAVFGVLFVGTWLRERNYAYWAACMTLVLALLAGSSGAGSTAPALLEIRLEAILAGALCAVAAAWFVLPVRTVDVVRRRLSDALVALDDLVTHAHRDPAEHGRALATLEHRFRDLEDVAPPLRWHRRIFARAESADHPAGWIDLARDSGATVTAFATAPPAGEPNRGAIRRAIGVSRRAVGQHGKADSPPDTLGVGAALAALGAVARSEMDALLHDHERPREVRREAGRGRRRETAERGAAEIGEER
jgi:hypothetical protein